MRKYAVLVLVAILALAISGCAPFSPAPPTKAILKGRVVVPEGVGEQALAGATVNVIDPVTGNIVATTTTDANGYYRVEVPPGGPYIIEAVKGSIKVLCVSPQVEAGETYPLGVADATSTAVALVFQAKVEAGEDPAEINLDEILEDPRIGNLIEAIEEALAAGEDPTTAPEVIHLVDVIVTPPAPAPAPTPTYAVTFKVTPADATVVVKDSKGNVVATTTPGVYKLTPGTYTYTVSKTGYKDATGGFTVVNKDLTIEVNLNLAPDTTPPTLKSLTAYLKDDGTRAATLVGGKWTLEWTVGETVTKIEAITSEPVKLAGDPAQAVVTMSGGSIPAGTVYGTIEVDETDSTKLIITPSSGNETAGLAGTFTFTVAAGVIEDYAGNKNAAISVILKVAPPEGKPVYIERTGVCYETIQAAIINVSPNDILHLAPGEFTITSNIEIAQPITILGNNSDINPNVSGRKPESILKSIVGENYYIDIQSSDVTIKGIKTDNVRINGYKPYFTSISNVLIENNIFTNIQGAAIHFRDASDAIAYNSSNVNIINNLIDETDWIRDDPFDGGSGIVLWGVCDSKVSGNTVKNVYLSGIQFARDKDITVENNTVETSNYSAIIVAQWNSGVITIKGNTLSATNRAVLYFWGFTYPDAHHPEIKVINNTIKNGPYGIQIGYAAAGRGYNDIKNADYDFPGNTFDNITDYWLIIYSNIEATENEFTKMNSLFSQVYGEGSTAKCIHDVDPFTYVVE